MLFLRALQKSERQNGKRSSIYPLSLPLFQNMERMELKKPVTIIAGDNGTGKTTLLEILALKLNAIRIDGTSSAYRNKTDKIMNAESSFKLEITRKPKRNFFFQAEDFIRYIDNLHAMRQDAEMALEEIKTNYAGRSDYAKGLAAMPFARTIYELDNMYDGDISEKSHGESFIEFFSSRIIKEGLYMLDEPEAALSQFNQLVMLNVFAEAEKNDCQLIISTHSPILAAYPGACIYEIKNGVINEVRYEEMESISFLKSFLNNKDSFLRNITYNQ